MKKFILGSLILVFILAGCLPTFGNQGNANSAVETAVAQTQAVENAISTSVALTAAAVAPNQQQPPAQQQPAQPTPTNTVEPSATFTANINANCRSGPGGNFDLLEMLNLGQSAKVIGKNLDVTPAWWQVELSDGVKCWLIGEAGEVTGDTSNIANVQSPPTPTPVPPASLWAGTWTTWQNTCFNNATNCEQMITVTFVMTGLNTLSATYKGFGCTSITTALTVSADGNSADGKQTYSGGPCGNTVEVHLTLDPNKSQFRGRANLVGQASMDAYWCGSRNGYGKPSPTR